MSSSHADPVNNDTVTPSAVLHALVLRISDGTVDDSVVRSLEELQSRVSGLVSCRNETLRDVATWHLPLLTVEYRTAVALLALPATTSAERQRNVDRASESLFGFLRRLDALDALPVETALEYARLLDEDEEQEDRNFESRENKIARFRRKKACEEEVRKWTALRQRRARLGIDNPHDELDGHDDDGLTRNLYGAELHHCAADAVDEIRAATRESEMLHVAVKLEATRHETARHKGAHEPSSSPRGRPEQGRATDDTAHRPLQVTHITQDSNTGQLVFRKDELRSQVFRPGWNQPTMSLERYAEHEIAGAVARSEAQQQAEAGALLRPRRYDQLVRDGMEDHADLVDASAELDRRWDDFKEANPRGSGNKMTDRGDRNF